ncbi:MAG: glycosyltransferase family 2 protein [Oscillospiraceae bacterium]|nr:glycosyltransferase family 2 protein [Oscillospiraceae bacterium]
MTNELMVSVAVITYRQEQYIRRALDSILAQQVNFKYEIVIGEDKSPDNTREILAEYAARYPDMIRVLPRPENLGASRNIYDVYTRCNGKYIANLEGDDYWTDPKKLQLQVDFLEQNPQYIGTTHFYRYVDVAENHLPELTEKYGQNPDCVYAMADYEQFLMPGQLATLVFHNLFKQPQYNYSIMYTADRLVSDRTIALILVLAGKLYRLPRFMSDYRWMSHGEHVQDIDQKNLYESFCYYQKLKQWAKQEAHTDVSFCAAEADLFYSAAYNCILHPAKENNKIAVRIFKQCTGKGKLAAGLIKNLAVLTAKKLRGTVSK